MKNKNKEQLFYEYFSEWVELYKVDAIRPVTLDKYYNCIEHLKNLVPDLKVGEITRPIYQKLLNSFAETHEKQTTMDFHHQIKSAILDAVDDGLIPNNPTRKIIIKGKNPRYKKNKFLNLNEVQSLIRELDLNSEINWDWFILLIIKTGLRFSEALALTPKDFDFYNQKLIINKTWDYKSYKGSFQDTKNESSKRKIQLDWQTAMQFSHLIKDKNPDKPIFVKNKVYNSTVNSRLEVLCKKANITTISIHGLRHTHASLLLFSDVSIATVASRLGHSSMTTTQETYLHIIKELEYKDNDKIMRHLSML